MSQLLDKIEAAKIARIAVSTLNKHMGAGRGPVATRVGGRVFFTPESVAAWIDSGVTRPPAKRVQP